MKKQRAILELLLEKVQLSGTKPVDRKVLRAAVDWEASWHNCDTHRARSENLKKNAPVYFSAIRLRCYGLSSYKGVMSSRREPRNCEAVDSHRIVLIANHDHPLRLE